MGETVLIVEDEPMQSSMLVDCMNLWGYTAFVAGNCKAALALLAGPPPDVVVMDIVLGDGKGRSVYRAMRADPAWSSVPVVFTTGLPEPDTWKEMQGISAPVLRKPFHINDLRISVVSALSLSRACRSQGRAKFAAR